MKKKKSSITIFALLLCACLLFVGILETQGYRNRKDDARNALEQCAVRVESLMSRLVHETDIMNALVQVEKGLPDREMFDSMAAAVASNEGVRAVQYLPDGVIAMSYPPEGEAGYIGKDVLQASEHSVEAEKAMAAKSIVLSGPYRLNHGGWGLVVSNPVYLEGRFWGFSAIVLDLPDSLYSVGMNNLKSSGYEYMLTARMEDGTRAVVDSTVEELPPTALSRDIQVPYNIWTLSIFPKNLWLFWVRLALELMCCAAVSFFLTMALRMYYNQKSYKERFLHQKELEAAYREVERSNQEKGAFLSRMSHDLRMPLNGIQGLVEIAMANGDNPPETVEYLTKIKNASSQLTLLVNQIMEESGPVAEDTGNTAPEVPENVPAGFGKGLRIMAVEDNPLNLEIMTTMLQMQGFEVELAENGLEALELYLERAAGWFDCILMDIRMPVMDGLTAARRIRASGREDAASIPIIAVTANAYESDGRQSRDAGMNAHITKPIDREHLLCVMRQCMDSGGKN